MRRRHSLCVHEPPCCFSYRGQGSDTSTEPTPFCKAYYPRKRRPARVPYPDKFHKRKDPLEAAQHLHPCAQNSFRSHRIGGERSVPALHFKSTKQIVRRGDETSSEGRSASGISSCLSVDVSGEMAAVNRQLDAILTRFERSLAGRSETSGKRPGLTSEQKRLLAMERPPLERLQELPLDHLRPRPPTHLRTKPGTSKENPKIRPETNPSLTVDPKLAQASEGVVRGESVEMMKTMWEDMKQQGLIWKVKEAGTKVQPIYAGMQLEDSEEIKIDVGGLTSMVERSLSKSKKVPPASTGWWNNSISTQTHCDFDSLLSKKTPEFPTKGMGDADRKGVDNAKNLELPDSLTSVDQRTPNPGGTVGIAQQNLYVPNTLNLPAENKDMFVYTAQTSLEALSKLKSFDEWLLEKGKENPANYSKDDKFEKKLNALHGEFLISKNRFDMISESYSQHLGRYKSPSNYQNISSEVNNFDLNRNDLSQDSSNYSISGKIYVPCNPPANAQKDESCKQSMVAVSKDGAEGCKNIRFISKGEQIVDIFNLEDAPGNEKPVSYTSTNALAKPEQNVANEFRNTPVSILNDSADNSILKKSTFITNKIYNAYLGKQNQDIEKKKELGSLDSPSKNDINEKLLSFAQNVSSNVENVREKPQAEGKCNSINVLKEQPIKEVSSCYPPRCRTPNSCAESMKKENSESSGKNISGELAKKIECHKENATDQCTLISSLLYIKYWIWIIVLKTTPVRPPEAHTDGTKPHRAAGQVSGGDWGEPASRPQAD